MNATPVSDLASVLPFNSAQVLAAIAWTLLHFIWQGCALAFAYALVRAVLRHTSASTRYVAGCVTLLMMAISPLATFAWLRWTNVVGSVEDPIGVVAPMTNASSATAPIERLHVAIVGVWILGMTACLVWVFVGWAQTQRYRSLPALPVSSDTNECIRRLSRILNVQCVVRLVDHVSVAAPITFGAVKPVILLPASILMGLSRSQLEAIIAHEMAHVRRCDFVVNLLQVAVESLLFYHPAVWWVSRQIRQEREYCCDDLAAETCGDAIDYARALAQIESLRSDSPRLGLSSQGGSLMKRIERLISSSPGSACSNRQTVARGAWGLGVTLTMLAAASTALAVGRPAERPAAGPTHLDQEIAGESQMEGAWLLQYAQAAPVQGEATLIEGEWVSADAAQFAWVVDGNSLEGDAIAMQKATTVLPEIVFARVNGLHEVRASIQACAPAIDAERMPSDGLVKAAQLAYPYNLLQLMPWVAPEAAELLVAPQPSVSSLFISRVAQLHRATRVRAETNVPLLRELPLIGAIQGQWVEAQPADEATLIEIRGQACEGSGEVPLEADGSSASRLLHLAPVVVRFEGDVLIEMNGERISADRIVVRGQATTETVKPEPTVEKEVAPRP